MNFSEQYLIKGGTRDARFFNRCRNRKINFTHNHAIYFPTVFYILTTNKILTN